MVMPDTPWGPLTSGVPPIYDARYDLNGDGVIDKLDLALVQAKFGCCRPSPCYDARMDFDGDGCITVIDAAMLAARLGAVRGAPQPPSGLPLPVLLLIGGAAAWVALQFGGRRRTR